MMPLITIGNSRPFSRIPAQVGVRSRVQSKGLFFNTYPRCLAWPPMQVSKSRRKGELWSLRTDIFNAQ